MQLIEMPQGFFLSSQKLVPVCSIGRRRHGKDQRALLIISLCPVCSAHRQKVSTQKGRGREDSARGGSFRIPHLEVLGVNE